MKNSDLILIAAAAGVLLFVVAKTGKTPLGAQTNRAHVPANALPISLGGLPGTISAMFGAGSQDYSSGQVSGIFGVSTADALDYDSTGGYLGQLGRDATDGYTPAEYGASNGAYTFGAGVEAPTLGQYMTWGKQ